MNTVLTSIAPGEPARILDRHAARRTAGIPTVSILVGPVGPSGRMWRCWSSAAGRSVIVANPDYFPSAACVGVIAEKVDLPALAVQSLARRAGRNPGDFLSAWRTKTRADRELFWGSLPRDADDDLLGKVAAFAVDQDSGKGVAASLCDLGEWIVPLIDRLVPRALWPAVLFNAGSENDFAAISRLTVQWATQVPAIPLAITVPVRVWDLFLTAAAESRAKALLREGEVRVSGIDAMTVERTLSKAGGVGRVAGTLATIGADAALVESAVDAVQATATPPTTEADDDCARSAAERFLFAFLDSLPETTGRFELNASLDFQFGSRPVEVDFLCRSQRIVIELDGYFHFLAPDGYRRDRTKDWELQRRGYVVLRFLAEDVIPHLEVIRDRILDALTATPIGGRP